MKLNRADNSLEGAFRKLMYESFVTDDDMREDEVYNESLERGLKEALLSLCVFGEDGDSLDEQFRSDRYLQNHYRAHCLADDPNRISRNTNVYYDFTNLDDYEERVKYIDNKQPDFVVSNLGSEKTINNVIRKLSSGNCCVLFNDRCGIPDQDPKAGEDDVVEIKINSMANEATTNFGRGNTADFEILDEYGNTKTLYPISFAKLMRKLDSLKQYISEEE